MEIHFITLMINRSELLGIFFGECNYRCSYCIAREDLINQDVKALNKNFSLNKLIYFYERNFSESKIMHFLEASGEPTLHPYFNEIITHLLQDKKSDRIFINSNLSTQFWKEVELDLSKLIITSFFHYEFSDYDDYFLTRERLMQLGATVTGGLILTDYNASEVERLSKMFDNEFHNYEYEIRIDYRKKSWRNSTSEKFVECNDFNNYDQKYDIYWDNDLSSSMHRGTKGMICGLQKHLINIEVNSGKIHQGNSNLKCKSLNRSLIDDLYSLSSIPDITHKLNPVICNEDYCASSCVSWMIPKYDIELYKRLIKTKRNGW